MEEKRVAEPVATFNLENGVNVRTSVIEGNRFSVRITDARKSMEFQVGEANLNLLIVELARLRRRVVMPERDRDEMVLEANPEWKPW
jgi:hypothetical protein